MRHTSDSIPFAIPFYIRSSADILRAYRFLSFIFQDEAAIIAAKQFALETRSKLLRKGCAKAALEVYVNYAHGDEGPVAWYSERKLPRLLALKSRWDPKNLFKWTNGLLQ